MMGVAYEASPVQLHLKIETWNATSLFVKYLISYHF